MKKIALLIIVCLLFGAVMVSAEEQVKEGQEGKTFIITPKAAMNVMLGKDALDTVGNQFGVLVEGEFKSLMEESKGILGLEVGYFGSSSATNTMFNGNGDPCDVKFKSSSIPVMATYKYIIPNSDFYAKVGAGVAFNKVKGEIETQEKGMTVYDDTKKSNKFAFELGFGAKFSNGVIAELLYINYGKAAFGEIAGNEITVNGKESSDLSAIQFNLGFSF